MAWIEAVRNVSQEVYQAELRKMKDGEVLAQELCQKGAMHAVQWILRDGEFTEQRLRAILEGLARQARWISAEARRRGLPTVDDPRGN